MELSKRVSPSRVFAAVGLGCVAMLAFGLYLQHVVGLEPCPMCIVQRYAMVFVAILSGLAWLGRKKAWQMTWAGLAILAAGFGAFVASRQSWLQRHPPEVMSCGRDFYGMIESFPLQRAIPMIFRGSGDCSRVDWTFLGGSIADWSLVCFGLIVLVLLANVWRLRRG